MELTQIDLEPQLQTLAFCLLLAIFLLTLLLGVWAAYDRPVAWLRFGLMALGLVAGLLIVYGRRRWGEREEQIAFVQDGLGRRELSKCRSSSD